MSPGYTRSELIEMAVQVERAGEKFYRGSASKVQGAAAKDLLGSLANDERRHAQVFLQLLAKGAREETRGITPEEARPYIESLVATSVLKYLVEGKVPSLVTTGDILDFALGFEKETLLFYYSIRDYLSSAAVTVVDRVILEEKDHVQRISALKASG